MAFKKESRLRKSSLISLVHKKGGVFKTSFFRVRYLKSKLPKSKITIVVSKKTEPLAVLRNKIKRKLSAEIYKNMSLLKLPVLLIFLPNKSVLLNKNNSLQESTISIMKKIQEKLLHKKYGI